MSSITPLPGGGITYLVENPTFDKGSNVGTAVLEVYNNGVLVLSRSIKATKRVVEETTSLKVSDVIHGLNLTTSFAFTTESPLSVRYDQQEIESAIAKVTDKLHNPS